MPIFRRHRALANDKKPIVRVLASTSPTEIAGRICPLRRGNNVVGRIEEVDVMIRDPLVSRQHACINVNNDQDRFTVVDYKSSNGTYLKGGPRITSQALSVAAGTVLIFGGTEVVLEYEGAYEREHTVLSIPGGES